MNILELATKRKTVRKFDSKVIPIERIITIIQVAREAPSGANYQGWRFHIIKNAETKKNIRKKSEEGEKKFYQKVSGHWAEWLKNSEINYKKPFLEDAPVLLVVYRKNDVPYSTESLWLAIGYILLALEEFGLGTVTYTPSYPEIVEEALEVPEGYRLEVILPIGNSVDDKPKEQREELEKLYTIYS
jgi:nitroreductase